MIYEEHVLGNTGCLFLGGSCIPFYRISGKQWILLDSGPRFIRQELAEYLQQNEIRVRAVLCSHAHFDHTENNRYLQERFGAKIVMSAFDAGCVYDTTALKGCFYSYTGHDNEIYNQEMLCRADRIFAPWQQQIEVEGAVFDVLSLPGHAASHLGYVTPDGAAYLADSIFSAGAAGAEKPVYMLNWTEALKTLEMIRGYCYKKYILAHGGVYDEIEGLAEENLHQCRLLLDGFYELFTEPVTLDEVVQKSAGRYHFPLKNYEKARIFERMIRSMTEYLLEKGSIIPEIEQGGVVYRTNYSGRFAGDHSAAGTGPAAGKSAGFRFQSRYRPI